MPATAFFLGILFSLFPYDYPLLWSSAPVADAHLLAVESHLKLLHNAPNLIVRILHIMTGLGLLGLVLKLYKPTESNLLFDGGSLFLYMVAVVVYITNIVKGLRIVAEGTYGLTNPLELDSDRSHDITPGGYDAETGDSVLGREDNLKVLAASNTILSLVLVGVLVLQVGQWYAERSDEKERRNLAENEKAAVPVKEPPKRQSSGREGREGKKQK